MEEGEAMEQIARFLDYMTVERNASGETLRKYRIELRKWAEFLGDAEITAPTKAAARSYLAKLQQAGLNETSIHTKWAAVRSFYRFLRQEGELKNFEIETVSVKVSKERLPRTISAETLEKLFAAPNLTVRLQRRDRAILELLYATGMRVSELCALKLESVNFATNEIRVVGKGDRERIVPFFGPAEQFLRAWVDRDRKHYVHKEAPTQALFVGKYGKPLDTNAIRTIIYRYAEQIGVSDGISPHRFRHTLATDLLNGDMDIRTIQEILGHADIKATMIYTHISQKRTKSEYLKAHPRVTINETTDGTKRIEHNGKLVNGNS